MKKYILFISIIIAQFTNAKDFQNYYDNARLNNDYYSIIDFGNNTKIKKDDFIKWANLNSSLFYSGIITDDVSKWVYGSTKEFVKQVRFIKAENEYAYKSYLNDLSIAEAQRKENDRLKAIAVGTAGAAALLWVGGKIYDGVKDSLQHLDFSGGSNSNNQNNSAVKIIHNYDDSGLWSRLYTEYYLYNCSNNEVKIYRYYKRESDDGNGPNKWYVTKSSGFSDDIFDDLEDAKIEALKRIKCN